MSVFAIFLSYSILDGGFDCVQVWLSLGQMALGEKSQDNQ
jgi:hypothetical protein